MDYKYSVLTTVIGNYEKLHEVLCPIEDDVEYICVTDNIELKSKTWKIIYDETLNQQELNGFDKSFLVRYNVFKYCNSNICVRIDGSLQPKKSFTEMVDKFINGNYDIGIMIHPQRTNIYNELKVWKDSRKIDQIENQTEYIKNKLNYDVKTNDGLYQLNFAINKKSELTKQIDNDMINMLHESSNNGHINRPNQTIFSAYINAKHYDKKIFAVSANITKNNYYNHYFHNSDILSNAMYHKLPNYIFNNKKIEIFE